MENIKHPWHSSHSSFLSAKLRSIHPRGRKEFAHPEIVRILLRRKKRGGSREIEPALKMLLVVVSNRESIRRDDRWKKKGEGKKRGETTDRKVSRGCKEIWGGWGSKILVETFLEENVIGRRRLCRNWERYTFSSFLGLKKAAWVSGGAGFRRVFLGHSLNLHAYRAVILVMVDVSMRGITRLKIFGSREGWLFD